MKKYILLICLWNWYDSLEVLAISSQDSTKIEEADSNEEYTKEHILVGISSAPSNAKIIKIAAKMAKAFNGIFTAIYVKTPESSNLSEENKERLQDNMRLAKRLGATIETVYGEEVALQIEEFARLSGVTKVILGRSAMSRNLLIGRTSLAEQLIENDPNMDVYIIPDHTINPTYRSRARFRYHMPKLTFKDIAISVIILVVATFIGFFFDYCGYSDANIIMIYIIGVLMNSILTAWAGYSLISSFVSVLVFNFFFTEPRLTLVAYDKDYPITFLVMFLVAFLASSLTVRLKEHARESARAAYRTKILFDTNQLLAQVKNRDEIIDVIARQIMKLLKRSLLVYQVDDGNLGEPKIYLQNGESINDKLLSKEREIALWTMQNNKNAGATTDTLADAKCLYLAIRMNETVYGVVGIVVGQKPIDVFEHSILLAILGECSLALESDRNRKEKEEAAILAGKEKLRANLLRAISHDLRTPLTSISGNASNLITNASAFDEETKLRMYSDIYDDSIWLNNLVENLLSVTRIEDGKMNIRMTAEVVDEVIEEAASHVNNIKKLHTIHVNNSEELLLATMDAKLIVQVLINLIDNAIKHTPDGSEILISSKRSGEWIEISVADNGDGVDDDMKEHIFEMFYTGKRQIADSRRSIGLGLALCKSIIGVHGGEITVTDNQPKGAVFTFTLKEYNPESINPM